MNDQREWADDLGDDFGISVVYPTRDRPELLVQSLTALLAGSVAPDEVIVVDQSRDDLTRRALEALGSERVTHVPSNETGLSNSRNMGLRYCRHPVVGFIDDDCFPAHNWLEQARRVIRRSPDAAVWIGQDFDQPEAIDPAVMAAAAERWFSMRGTGDPWRLGPTGGDCFFRRETFDRVGPFDPILGQGALFPGAEDGDMVYRVLQAGLEATYSDAVRVHHLVWRSEEQQIDNSHNYGLGVGAMLAKYAANGDYFPLLRIFPRRFLPCYLGVVWHAVSLQKRRFWRSLKWSQSILRGYRDWRAMHPTASPEARAA